eukprot:6198983-Pleurochrysis_carterae.AAC.11
MKPRGGPHPPRRTSLQSGRVAAHVEEDARARQAELKLPLDHGHLVLSRPPDVTARRARRQRAFIEVAEARDRRASAW